MSEYDSFARFYDLEYRSYSDDLAMYATLAARAGTRILELACGTGRVAIHLARAGFQVTGIDTSEAMLAIARERLAAEAPQIRDRVFLVQADMRRFRLAGTFDLAIYAINSFMHLMTHQDQARSLKCVARRLREGGLLAADIFNPELSLYDSEGRMFYERTMSDDAAGASVIKMVSTAVDRPKQINRLTFYYDETSRDGTIKRNTATITQHYLYRHEMEHLVRQAGYEIADVFGDLKMRPMSVSSPKMVFVVERQSAGPAASEATCTTS